ncbi:hypothetical protein RJ640_028349 [Escallonia rubra]|uniref:Autophagy-related protein 13 N-terminal domain-containing protein n=1 Tax=Escallonia rubra TaxID=112253 RepID=A0AA88R4X0_9ASTE|nr:hypothetical protein RJ640_028349 [Escallonia rubra]
MDLHSGPHGEYRRFEQILSQFLLKSLHIVLDSRVPSIRPRGGRGRPLSGAQSKKSDKWFSLALGDRPSALENLNFWHRNLMEPMVIDIILVQETQSDQDMYVSSGLGTVVETLIERWVVQCESGSPMGFHGDSSASHKKTYKKLIILLRSLYSTMRLLPAHRAFRKLCLSSKGCDFDIIYKVSSFSAPFSRAEEEVMKQYGFVPVDAPQGRLSISVTYRESLSDFNLETSASFPPQIITDYVGSPATDPLRAFPSTDKGFCATSVPSRGMQSPSSIPFQRPHSWTGGLHRGAPLGRKLPLGGSPPAYPSSFGQYEAASSPTDNYRFQNYRHSNHHKATSFDDYQLSPPFSPSPSPSASPSPPTYLSSGNPVQNCTRGESSPVSIPHPMLGRSPRYLSPNLSDPNRNSLPPLSPRSLKHDPSYQDSPSGIRSGRRSDLTRTGDPSPGITNYYSGQKGSRDSKDDSGRFSGLLSSSGSPRVGLSRSSSRFSFQDDLDDSDFSCPFIVDDVDTPETQARQNVDGNKASEFTSQTFGVGRKSQDAAVGALVHMLRTAPPLRQDSSCYSSRSLNPGLEGDAGTASGFFLPRKTSDALEELRVYKGVKDLLLSKSGARFVSKEDPTG